MKDRLRKRRISDKPYIPNIWGGKRRIKSLKKFLKQQNLNNELILGRNLFSNASGGIKLNFFSSKEE